MYITKLEIYVHNFNFILEWHEGNSLAQGMPIRAKFCIDFRWSKEDNSLTLQTKWIYKSSSIVEQNESIRYIPPSVSPQCYTRGSLHVAKQQKN